jgi:hypothetical protein
MPMLEKGNVDNLYRVISFYAHGSRFTATRVLRRSSICGSNPQFAVPILNSRFQICSFPAVGKFFGRTPLDHPFDRGSSYFLGSKLLPVQGPLFMEDPPRISEPYVMSKRKKKMEIYGSDIWGGSSMKGGP